MQDTICAISTPHGSGGIAVIRVSGPNAFPIVQKLWKGKPIDQHKSHTAHLGTILNPDQSPLDQALITTFHAPNTFTGLNTIEISVHGSPYIQQQLIHNLISLGARLAEPGEFTRLAHQAGHIDLTQAEAIADLIAAQSRAQHSTAIRQLKGNISNRLANLRFQLLEIATLLELELDFSEEDVNFASRDHLLQLATDLNTHINSLLATFRAGNAIRQGIPVAIIGPTNAGKSSLLNVLTNDDRAIVSDIHGTTRDTIHELITIADHTYRLIDTAGLRQTNDPIEKIGIQRSLQAISQADIIILTLDSSAPIPA
ncbi:MAG: tRNA uridine-5-carboxymethylaminomethyl(34) synthesis GTPase MnmE, partial [Muribaculaceae bacterium]|nr:tRNA uridine-5-carboxymethylaminomethyl(34) synthesis GTPase MnmE [Muribaculaceae bacterium]